MSGPAERGQDNTQGSSEAERCLAASLIRDYVVRTALARQYEAGKESIAVI